MLADVVLAQGAAAPVVPAAAAFAGDALRFEVAGGGASIDPATGALTLPTDVRRAGETVTVTATNSGGAATATFAVTVLAAPAASGALEAAVFAVGARRDGGRGRGLQWRCAGLRARRRPRGRDGRSGDGAGDDPDRGGA